MILKLRNGFRAIDQTQSVTTSERSKALLQRIFQTDERLSKDLQCPPSEFSPWTTGLQRVLRALSTAAYKEPMV
jgi:hypothetical protein